MTASSFWRWDSDTTRRFKPSRIPNIARGRMSSSISLSSVMGHRSFAPFSRRGAVRDSSIWVCSRGPMTVGFTSMHGMSGTDARRGNVISIDNVNSDFGTKGVTRKRYCVTQLRNATRKNYIPGWSRSRLRILSALNFETLLFASFGLDGSRAKAKT